MLCWLAGSNNVVACDPGGLQRKPIIPPVVLSPTARNVKVEAYLPSKPASKNTPPHPHNLAHPATSASACPPGLDASSASGGALL